VIVEWNSLTRVLAALKGMRSPTIFRPKPCIRILATGVAIAMALFFVDEMNTLLRLPHPYSSDLSLNCGLRLSSIVRNSGSVEL
jgi:hypothetical protein